MYPLKLKILLFISHFSRCSQFTLLILTPVDRPTIWIMYLTVICYCFDIRFRNLIILFVSILVRWIILLKMFYNSINIDIINMINSLISGKFLVKIQFMKYLLFIYKLRIICFSDFPRNYFIISTNLFKCFTYISILPLYIYVWYQIQEIKASYRNNLWQINFPATITEILYI